MKQMPQTTKVCPHVFDNIYHALVTAQDTVIKDLQYYRNTVKKSKKWKVMKLDPDVPLKIAHLELELQEIIKLLRYYPPF